MKDMEPGAWLGGYQAVSPAPVEFIKGDRSRHIDGHNVKGAWSDPWWMYDPDRGWAVARRWRSKDQDGLEWRDGRHHRVHIPAAEEREVTPWTPEPASEPAEADAVQDVESADEETVTAPGLPQWQAANNGAGTRRWFLIRGLGVESDRIPVRDRYHCNARGDLIRYASYQSAGRAASRLNAEETASPRCRSAEAENTTTVRVWDVDTDETREIPVPEAAAGMVRYARSLGPGTPACGEAERRALELLRNGAGAMATPRDAQDTNEVQEETTGAEDMGMVRAAIAADRAVKRSQQQQARGTRRQEVAVPQPAQAARGAVPRIPGDQLLDLIRDQWFGWYARLPSPAALDAVTLWAAHCHMRDEHGILVFRASPRLFMLSSEPGSGKSFALELVGRVAPSWFGLDLEPSAPGLVYTISREHATVTLDEADVTFGAGARHEAVRAIINGGTYRHGTVLNGRGAKANRVPVFGPLALAGLDSMEKDTGGKLAALLTRGIKIRMEKASGEDRPPRLTRQAEESADGAKMWLERWAAQVRDEVADAEPEMPEGVEGRAEDIWAPLLAVAQAAGGDWPDRAFAACQELALSKPGGGEGFEDQFAEFAGSFGGL